MKRTIKEPLTKEQEREAAADMARTNPLSAPRKSADAERDERCPFCGSRVPVDASECPACPAKITRMSMDELHESIGFEDLSRPTPRFTRRPRTASSLDFSILLESPAIGRSGASGCSAAAYEATISLF